MFQVHVGVPREQRGRSLHQRQKVSTKYSPPFFLSPRIHHTHHVHTSPLTGPSRLQRFTQLVFLPFTWASIPLAVKQIGPHVPRRQIPNANHHITYSVGRPFPRGFGIPLNSDSLPSPATQSPPRARPHINFSVAGVTTPQISRVFGMVIKAQ